MTHRRVVAAGYMPLDIIISTDGRTARQGGGTAANVAAILAFLGWDAVLAGQTGDDIAADELTADLAGAGVRTDQIRRARGAATPRLVHSIRPDGHSFAYSCPICRSRLPRSRPLTVEQAHRCIAAYPRPSVFFFDRANAGTLTLAEHYAHHGALVMFEPSVPANAELLRRAAAVADVIKHSDDRSVGGLHDLPVRTRSDQLRIITHGAEGLELRCGRRRARKLPALATLAVDTGGAGDWTTAGLLHKVAHRAQLDLERVEDGLRFGQAIAAVSCAVPGARGLMALTRQTVLRRARSAIVEGGMTTEPRLPRPTALPTTPGCCPSCLVPTSMPDATVASNVHASTNGASPSVIGEPR